MAKKYEKNVVILDRPNPVNGISIEGNCLSPDVKSFVGRFPIPMRHGLTTGEISLLFNELYNINCNLEIIRMRNWKRQMYFEDTGLPWILPSPNLPTPESAVVYPGQVLLEGTNISEARGTTKPFELFGAPYIKTDKIISDESVKNLPGIHLRPTAFEPTSGKHAGNTCYGFQIHITNREEYKPYHASLSILQSIIKNHPDHFLWKQPPYEYEYEKLPIDLIIGNSSIRKQLEEGISIDILEKNWAEQTMEYNDQSKLFHIY